MRAQSSVVIPGRASWRGPGIHNLRSWLWIPGSTLRVAPECRNVGHSVGEYQRWTRERVTMLYRASRMDCRVKPGDDEALFPGRDAARSSCGALLRRTGIAPDTTFCTAPALQRTAPQELRAALRPGNGVLWRGTNHPGSSLSRGAPRANEG
jgi:hypothetical protein